jgi:hypothetical protein
MGARWLQSVLVPVICEADFMRRGCHGVCRADHDGMPLGGRPRPPPFWKVTATVRGNHYEVTCGPAVVLSDPGQAASEGERAASRGYLLVTATSPNFGCSNLLIQRSDHAGRISAGNPNHSYYQVPR